MIVSGITLVPVAKPFSVFVVKTHYVTKESSWLLNILKMCFAGELWKEIEQQRKKQEEVVLGTGIMQISRG